MGSIKDRIRKYIDYKGISKREFCRKISASPGFLVSESDITSEYVSNIVNTYPDVSLRWLVTGQGEMLETNNVLDSANYVEMREDILELIKSQQHTILLQQKLINKKEGEKLAAAEGVASADAEETA